MAFLWRGYLRLLRERTLPTQMATGGFIGFTADSVSQRVLEDKEDYNWARTARQTFYSSCIFAPMANRMFYLLNKIQLKSIWTTAVLRTGVDMVTFMPFASFMYFTCIGTMEGRPWDEIQHRWRTNFPTLIRNQYMFFAPAQIINMAILPLYARPPFINTVGLFWTLYLANVNSRHVPITPSEKKLEVQQMQVAQVE